MTDCLRIQGGQVYDPANSIDGQVRDILIADGKVVASLPADARPRVIDATGMVVMPGGVDIHCHVASTAINRARRMQGEEHASHVHASDRQHNLRSGSGLLTPSTFVTGYRYAALGYTSVLEAAVSPSGARQTHLELDDTPNVDAGFLLLLANHQHLIELVDRGDTATAIALIAHMLQRTGALGIKVVNPGGVASWRHDAAHTQVLSLDESIAGTRATPRKMLELIATAAEQLQLPHAPHVHCNQLGTPGNVDMTLDTLHALQGRRVHLTHLQFHAYGRTRTGTITSAASQLISYINDHANVTADVGQVIFGDAFTLTGDTPLEYMLWKLAGKSTRPYVSIENDLEAGCGLMPWTYSDKEYLHSLQWAIGLELMLSCSDPWRMLLSTDHPNGGSFLAYPRIIAALMSQAVRQEQLGQAHPRAMRHSRLKDLTREMTLGEIAIITRAGPARVLGLQHKGHLGPGADADVTVYNRDLASPQRMFESPRYVIARGRVLVEEGQLRSSIQGQRFCAAIEPSDQGEAALANWLTRHGSYDPQQFGLHPFELSQLRPVPPRAQS